MRIGTLMLLAFVLLRYFNLYGDPYKWEPQIRGTLFSVFSFMKITKYPASLHFILITVGIGFLSLAFLDNVSSSFLPRVRKLGQVAMFFYIIHIPIIRIAAKLYRLFFNSDPSIAFFYFILGCLLVILYFICNQYFLFKKKNKEDYFWLKYI